MGCLPYHHMSSMQCHIIMSNGRKCKSTTTNDLEISSDMWCLSWILSTMSMITNMRSSTMEFHFPSRGTGTTSEHGYRMRYQMWGGLDLKSFFWILVHKLQGDMLMNYNHLPLLTIEKMAHYRDSSLHRWWTKQPMRGKWMTNCRSN